MGYFNVGTSNRNLSAEDMIAEQLRLQQRSDALSGFLGGSASYGTPIPDASLEDLQNAAGRNAQRTQMVENLLGQVGTGSSPFQQNINPIMQKLNQIADNPGPSDELITRLMNQARSSSAATQRNAQTALTEGTLGRGMDGPAFAAAQGLIRAQGGADLDNSITDIMLQGDQQGRSERAKALDSLLRGADMAQRNTVDGANLLSKLSTPVIPGSSSGGGGGSVTSSNMSNGGGGYDGPNAHLAGANRRTGIVGPVMAGASGMQRDMIRGHQKYLAQTGQDVARTFNGTPFFGYTG